MSILMSLHVQTDTFVYSLSIPPLSQKCDPMTLPSLSPFVRSAAKESNDHMYYDIEYRLAVTSDPR